MVKLIKILFITLITINIFSLLNMTNIITMPEIIKVEIKGEVENPGVYTITKGSRVEDLLKKVKLKKTASLEFNNLSKKLNDEDVVIIYSDQEIENFQNGNTAVKYVEKECICPSIKNISCFNNAVTNLDGLINNTGKVSLNSALIDELITLPGIGEAKAKLIIEYREKNNGFKDIEEIMNIKGIGEKMFEKIKPYITL